MAKHVLNSAADELDFFLIGISCLEDQYRLVNMINDVLGTDLTLSNYIPLNLKSGKIFNFSLYSYTDNELGIQYEMIPNSSNFEEPNLSRGEEGSLFSSVDIDESVKLIKELPKTDYFLILKGEDLHMNQYKIIDRLKAVQAFVQIQQIEPDDLPSRRNLIF